MSRDIINKVRTVLLAIATVNLMRYIDWELVNTSVGPLPILIVTGLLVAIGLLAILLLIIKVIRSRNYE